MSRAYIESSPLSVDTEEDLADVKNLMEKDEQN
jgi:CMP-2-keto-3-deoxyoctulosonic acid synthetase